MEEDRHLDGRACVAVACGISSLLVVFLSPEVGIFFGAFAWIFAGASVTRVDDVPSSERKSGGGFASRFLNMTFGS